MSLLKAASQLAAPESWDVTLHSDPNESLTGTSLVLGTSLHKRLFTVPSVDDDDYYSRHHTLAQRQMLVRQLLRLLCLAIRKNNQNAVGAFN